MGGLLRRLSAVSALGVLLLAMAAGGGGIMGFVDVVSAVLVFGGGALAWLAASGGGVGRALRTVYVSAATRAEVEAARVDLRAGRRAMWGMTLASVVVGLVQLAQTLDDPNSLGPALAVSILPLVYGFVADLFVLGPWLTRVEQRRVTQVPGEQAAALGADDQRSIDAMNDLREAVRRRASEPASR